MDRYGTFFTIEGTKNTENRHLTFVVSVVILGRCGALIVNKAFGLQILIGQVFANTQRYQKHGGNDYDG